MTAAALASAAPLLAFFGAPPAASSEPDPRAEIAREKGAEKAREFAERMEFGQTDKQGFGALGLMAELADFARAAMESEEGVWVAQGFGEETRARWVAARRPFSKEGLSAKTIRALDQAAWEMTQGEPPGQEALFAVWAGAGRVAAPGALSLCPEGQLAPEGDGQRRAALWARFSNLAMDPAANPDQLGRLREAFAAEQKDFFWRQGRFTGALGAAEPDLEALAQEWREKGVRPTLGAARSWAGFWTAREASAPADEMAFGLGGGKTALGWRLAEESLWLCDFAKATQRARASQEPDPVERAAARAAVEWMCERMEALGEAPGGEPQPLEPGAKNAKDGKGGLAAQAAFRRDCARRLIDRCVAQASGVGNGLAFFERLGEWEAEDAGAARRVAEKTAFALAGSNGIWAPALAQALRQKAPCVARAIWDERDRAARARVVDVNLEEAAWSAAVVSPWIYETGMDWSEKRDLARYCAGWLAAQGSPAQALGKGWKFKAEGRANRFDAAAQRGWRSAKDLALDELEALCEAAGIEAALGAAPGQKPQLADESARGSLSPPNRAAPRL